MKKHVIVEVFMKKNLFALLLTFGSFNIFGLSPLQLPEGGHIEIQHKDDPEDVNTNGTWYNGNENGQTTQSGWGRISFSRRCRIATFCSTTNSLHYHYGYNSGCMFILADNVCYETTECTNTTCPG